MATNPSRIFETIFGPIPPSGQNDKLKKLEQIIVEKEEDEYRVSNIIFEQNSKLKLAHVAIKAIETECKEHLKRIQRIKKIIGDDFTQLGGTDPIQRLELPHFR